MVVTWPSLSIFFSCLRVQFRTVAHCFGDRAYRSFAVFVFVFVFDIDFVVSDFDFVTGFGKQDSERVVQFFASDILETNNALGIDNVCLLYTSPSPRDRG